MLLFGYWYMWHRFKLYRALLKKEVHEAEHTLHTTFDVLKEDLEDHIRLLDKAKSVMELNQKEKRLLNHLKNSFRKAEKKISKEIEDIDKEL